LIHGAKIQKIHELLTIEQSMFQSQLRFALKEQFSPPIYMQQIRPQLLATKKEEQKELEMRYA
jgi:hypothetical protein